MTTGPATSLPEAKATSWRSGGWQQVQSGGFEFMDVVGSVDKTHIHKGLASEPPGVPNLNERRTIIRNPRHKFRWRDS